MKNILIIRNKNKIGGPATWLKYLKSGFGDKNIKVVISNPNLLIALNLRHFQLVHIYEYSPTVLAIVLMANIKRIPVLATIHADPAPSGSTVNRFLANLIVANCLKRAALVTTPTNYLRKLLIERAILTSRKIEVIPNGIDLDYIDKINPLQLNRNKNINIIQITDFKYPQKAKGALDTIKSVNKINNKSGNKKLKLIIIGGRGLLPYFKKKYSSDNILFTGLLDHETVLRYIKAADVIVHSSYLDNLPLAILEAFACQKPVIYYATGGIEEAASGCAVLSKPYELAESLEKIAFNKQKQKKIGRLARARALKYSNKIISKKFETLYNSLIDV